MLEGRQSPRRCGHSNIFENVAEFLTSRADTNCRGRRADFMSGMLDSRSKSAFAMLVSVSEGCCRDGLVEAILLRAAMIAVY